MMIPTDKVAVPIKGTYPNPEFAKPDLLKGQLKILIAPKV